MADKFDTQRKTFRERAALAVASTYAESAQINFNVAVKNTLAFADALTEALYPPVPVSSEDVKVEATVA